MTRWATQIAWGDVPHLSEEAKAGLANSYSPHERDARTKGTPALGSGAVYPVPESEIVCQPFVIPAYYKCAYALDVGWNRTAALWGAIDYETDVLYLWAEHYLGSAEPAIHAQAIKSRGIWIPGVVDPAARGRSQADGESLFNIYTNPELGIGLELSKAQNAVEAGIYEVWTRLSTGRLKVFSTLQNWLAEYRMYRRDEKGKIVKENDHLMDTTRYLVASGLAIAIPKPPELWDKTAIIGAKPRHLVDFEPFKDAFNMREP